MLEAIRLGPPRVRPDWQRLAEDVLAGRDITRQEAAAVLDSPDTELLQLLDAAFRVRRRHFGLRVQLYYLVNAKSGLCPEDCSYCSQSRSATSGVDRYPLLERSELVRRAGAAAERGATTYCIVTSGTGPTERELDQVIEAVQDIKSQFPLRVCCCLGILRPGQARRLAEAGVDRFNHNLNTSAGFHESIVTTHTYQDRVRTLHEVREAGMSVCSGGIIGLGEAPSDVIELAFSLRELGVESIPVNFLHPIAGTRMEGVWNLNPRYCLKVLAMFRLVNPRSEIRIAGGRELHLGSLQAMGLYPANSLFISDYLTTRGQAAEDDIRMIEDLGFEVVRPGESAGIPV